MHEEEISVCSEDEIEETLAVTGLRKKKLVALVTCLVILFLISLFILIINIMLISTLKMNANGMKYLKFTKHVNPKTGDSEKTVEMMGEKITFEHVIAKEKVIGFPDKNIDFVAPRIVASARQNDTQLDIQDGRCRIEHSRNFQVLSTAGRTMFSARHPTVSINKKIKKISASKIITDKIRSAVDEPLKIEADDVTIRGNERIRIEGRNLNLGSQTRLVFNTSTDGKIWMKARVRLADGPHSLPLSSSPALSASIDALRLCACATGSNKLFLVPANKKCHASFTFCQ